MKKLFSIMLALVLVFGLMVSSVGAIPETPETPETPLCNGRINGGGQIRAVSGIPYKNGRDINYNISFGLCVRVVDGEWIFRNTTVQFHNVSVDELDKGMFKGEEIINEFIFFENDAGVEYADNYYQVARYQVLGKFNGVDGYRMIIRIEDAGEPGRKDNIRIELYNPADVRIYDTYSSGDFPGESNNVGSARHFLDKGNFQVKGEICDVEPTSAPN